MAQTLYKTIEELGKVELPHMYNLTRDPDKFHAYLGKNALSIKYLTLTHT